MKSRGLSFVVVFTDAARFIRVASFYLLLTLSGCGIFRSTPEREIILVPVPRVSDENYDSWKEDRDELDRFLDSMGYERPRIKYPLSVVRQTRQPVVIKSYKDKSRVTINTNSNNKRSNVDNKAPVFSDNKDATTALDSATATRGSEKTRDEVTNRYVSGDSKEVTGGTGINLPAWAWLVIVAMIGGGLFLYFKLR